jgi:RNA polymerase sigma-70 factor (ECF subfamily)
VSVALDRDSEVSDESLARAAQGGQVRALEALIERHQARVLRVLVFLGVARDDREDVAQEVFVRVFRHLDTFKPGQVFGAWIYRVTVNAAHDWRTRRGRRDRGEAPWDDALDPDDRRPGPAASLGQRELRRALFRALETLTDRERCVFVLRELEGLETGEVARALQISSITVRRHLFQARRRLQASLRGEEERAVVIERIARDPSSHG